MKRNSLLLILFLIGCSTFPMASRIKAIRAVKTSVPQASTVLIIKQDPKYAAPSELDLALPMAVHLQKINSKLEIYLIEAFKGVSLNPQVGQVSSSRYDLKVEFGIVDAKGQVWVTESFMTGKPQVIAKRYGGLERLVLEV